MASDELIFRTRRIPSFDHVANAIFDCVLTLCPYALYLGGTYLRFLCLVVVETLRNLYAFLFRFDDASALVDLYAGGCVMAC